MPTMPILNFQFDLIIYRCVLFCYFGFVQIWLRTLNECKYPHVHCIAYERSGPLAHHHQRHKLSKCWPRLCSHIANSRQYTHIARLQKLTKSCNGRRLHVINHLSTTNSVPFTTFTATIVCCLMMMIFHLFAKFELQLFNIFWRASVLCVWMCFFSRLEFLFWTHNFMKFYCFVSTKAPWNDHHN